MSIADCPSVEPALDRLHPDFIPVASPSIGPLEKRYVADALDHSQVSGGPWVEKFEREFAAAHGRRFGVACNSGTTALQLALVASGVKRLDFVVMPDHTMIAVANAALYCGAKLALIGGNDFVGNVHGDELEEYAVTSKAKAVIAVHTYAQKADGLSVVGSRSGATLIEDCAEAHYVPGVGRQGRFACFSFYGNKIITTGEGGIVLCDEQADAERLRSLRAHAFTPRLHFRHQELAFGYRMTEMQGAIGCAQHERRHELIAQRKQIACWYTDEAGDAQSYPLLWVVPVQCRDREMRDTARFHLADNHIETRTYFVPLSEQTHVKPHVLFQRNTEQSRAIADRGLYLPLWPGMTRENVHRITSCLKQVLGNRI